MRSDSINNETLTAVAKEYFSDNPEGVDLLNNNQFEELFEDFYNWNRARNKNIGEYDYDALSQAVAYVLLKAGIDYLSYIHTYNTEILKCILLSGYSTNELLKLFPELGTLTISDNHILKDIGNNYFYIKSLNINVKNFNIEDFSMLQHINAEKVVFNNDTIIKYNGKDIDTLEPIYSSRHNFYFACINPSVAEFWLPKCIKHIGIGALPDPKKLTALYVNKDIDVVASLHNKIAKIAHVR